MPQIQKESEDRIFWYISVMTKQKIVQTDFFFLWYVIDLNTESKLQTQWLSTSYSQFSCCSSTKFSLLFIPPIPATSVL